jgi:hypothetical protein
MSKQTLSDLSQSLAERAQVIVDDGYKPLDIMKSAFSDFKALGSMAGVMSVMSTDRLTPQQVEISKRIVAKVLAVLDKQEEKPALRGLFALFATCVGAQNNNGYPQRDTAVYDGFLAAFVPARRDKESACAYQNIGASEC